jgi:SAM-dependent methyltransferase
VSETYDLNIPEEGLDYNLLDLTFNPTTKAFIENNDIEPGMRVLDVGSGSGVMTHYLAKLVGPNGQVLSIDNSQEQLQRAERYCQQQGENNITFRHLSVYELASLKETFDVIYCRFVLHHVHRPRLAIQLFYQHLHQGGIYIAEEGIVSSAFSYPPSNAWRQSRGTIAMPDEEEDGVARDGEFGMKLYYWMKKTGFNINDIKLIQPVLSTKAEKVKLLEGHDAYKNTALLHGKSEQAWQDERNELIQLAQDECSIIGFYQSCQVCGIKP